MSLPPAYLDGLAALQEGNYSHAMECFAEALPSMADSPQLWYYWGEAAMGARNWAEALRILEHCQTLDPDHIPTLYNLGVVHLNQEQYPKAADCFYRITTRDPQLVQPAILYAQCLYNTGQWQKTIDVLDPILAANPAAVDAYNFKGLALHDLHFFEKAAQCFTAGLGIDPDNSVLNMNLANTLGAMGEAQGALRFYDRVIQTNPTMVGIYNNMANAYTQIGMVDEALHHYQQECKNSPDDPMALSNYLFCLLHKDGVGLDDIYTAHKQWETRFAAPLYARQQPHTNTKDPHRPLRIGFVSGDFRNHPVGRFTLKTITALHADPHYTVFLYANQHETDTLTTRFQQHCTQFHRTLNLSDDELTAHIRRDEIDILFDLTGHNARERLQVFARRPAPVQVTWAGYMATTGLSCIDWIVGDAWQTPASHQPYYAERIYTLPHSFICFEPADYSPAIQPVLPSAHKPYFTFACFNKPMKISSRAIDNWSAILRRVPNSRLALKFNAFQSELTRNRFYDLFAERGIEKHRLILEGFSPHDEVLALYSDDIDMGLDSLPYTGSTTTLEALWNGVPVVTLRGTIFPANHSASYLHTIGMPELIANNDHDFIDKAVALALDTPRLAAYRETLRHRMAASPLYQPDLFVPDFKKALQHFWHTYCMEPQ